MPRAQSFWGWGWADRFPDPPALRELGRRASLLVGDLDEPRAPAGIEAVELPRPRVEPPPAVAVFCSQSAFDRASHAHGKAYGDLVRGFAGDFRSAPDVVALVRGENDVEALFEWAAAKKIALVPFGGGTSVVGGVEAAPPPGFSGVASVDLRGLDRVLEIDAVSRAARIQAGATGPALESALHARGFTLRHFPQSFEFSTLGGWIATRAGGHFATLYTRIDELVESVRMLTPTGPCETRRLPSSGAGPDPNRLICGSEGALGVITEAWMRVQPRPRWKLSASVHFAEEPAAVRAARELSQSGLHPANCRLLDAREAMLNGVTADGSCVIIVAFESADHPVGPWMERALAIATALGGECPMGVVDRSEASASDAAASWRTAFIEAPYLQNAMVALGVLADTFETACTWSRFEALKGAVVEAVQGALERACGGGVISCRFTHVYPDGPAPYFTFVGKARRGGELEQWREVKSAALDAVAKAGGTVTHHHAVGRLHRPWYDRERPEPFARALKAAKDALDPTRLLNPGVLID